MASGSRRWRQDLQPRSAENDKSARNVYLTKEDPCKENRPNGLTVEEVPEELAAQVLQELMPIFNRQRSTKGNSSDMFEVGWSFSAMDNGEGWKVAHPLSDFPRLRELLELATKQLSGPDSDIGEEFLNVICRRYGRGQGIPAHVDRKEMFEEDVYGCVVENTSDQALEFKLTGKDGRPRDPEVVNMYRVAEKPGLCFLQRGDARFKWCHGVQALGRGRRVSVTWRWMQPSALGTGCRGPKGGKGKGSKGGKGGKGSKGGKGKGGDGKDNQREVHQESWQEDGRGEAHQEGWQEDGRREARQEGWQEGGRREARQEGWKEDGRSEARQEGWKDDRRSETRQESWQEDGWRWREESWQDGWRKDGWSGDGWHDGWRGALR